MCGPPNAQTFLELEYCLIDAETDERLTISQFAFSLFDFDQQPAYAQGGPENSGRECLYIGGFDDYAVSDTTELTMEDDINGRTKFCSSVAGYGADNPTDPNNLEQQQLDRSIAFTFKDTSCFQLTYTVDCCMSSGRNFLFAGDSVVLPLCDNPPPSAP